MSADFERRLANSLRYGASQVRPAADPLRAADQLRAADPPHGEDRLRAADPLRGVDPLPVIGIRGLHGAGRDRARRRSLAVAAAALLAVFVVATPMLVHGRHDRGRATGFVGGGLPASGSGGVRSATPLSTARAAGATVQGTAQPVWRLTSGLYRDHHGVHPVRADEVTVSPGGWAYLIVTVAPSNPDGKTYLQARMFGTWITLGPHELEQDSRVTYLLWPPTDAAFVTYRVYVPPARGFGAAYSTPVTVRIQR